MLAPVCLALVLSVATHASAQASLCLKDGEGRIECGAPANRSGGAINLAAADTKRAEKPAPERKPEKLRQPTDEPRRTALRLHDRQAFLVRGGDIIIADGAGFLDDITAPYFALGYRSPTVSFGLKHSRLSLEGESLYFAQSDRVDIGVGAISTNFWTLAFLGSVRWQWDWNFPLRPFASVGVGPAYTHLSVEDGFVNVDVGEIDLGYTGRAGFEARLAGPVSLEAGYRHFGISRPGGFGAHAAEMGLVWRF